jgi:hypothetical protein
MGHYATRRDKVGLLEGVDNGKQIRAACRLRGEAVCRSRKKDTRPRMVSTSEIYTYIDIIVF